MAEAGDTKLDYRRNNKRGCSLSRYPSDIQVICGLATVFHFLYAFDERIFLFEISVKGPCVIGYQPYFRATLRLILTSVLSPNMDSMHSLASWGSPMSRSQGHFWSRLLGRLLALSTVGCANGAFHGGSAGSPGKACDSYLQRKL